MLTGMRKMSPNRVNSNLIEFQMYRSETADLRTRVRAFRNAAFLSGNSHAAGCEFRKSGFASQFPKETIYYDFAETASKEAAEEGELALHDQYRKRFS
jgi:hypothetical protein